MKLFPNIEKEWNNLKSPYKTEIKYFQIQNVKTLLRKFVLFTDKLTPLLLKAQKFHMEKLIKINMLLSKRLDHPMRRIKYGHNPNLIVRDEEIYNKYVFLREEGISPGDRVSFLSHEYSLAPSTIKDIVQGKTRRKKKLG